MKKMTLLDALYGFLALFVVLDCVLTPRVLIQDYVGVIAALLGLILLAFLIERGKARDLALDNFQPSKEETDDGAESGLGWVEATSGALLLGFVAVGAVTASLYGLPDILAQPFTLVAWNLVVCVLSVAVLARMHANGIWSWYFKGKSDGWKV